MKNMHSFKCILIVCLGFILTAFAGSASDTVPSDAEIISTLQTMAQGGYSEADWNEVVYQIDEAIAQARAEETWGRVVDMTVFKARAFSMRNQNGEALQLLLDVIQEYEQQSVMELKKAYLEAAEIYARLGQEQRVREINDRFQKSSVYDAQAYGFEGGSGPDDPIVLARPSASGPKSISVTALQVAEKKAHYGAGQPFPHFSAETWNGRPYSLSNSKGQVVLIDLWLPAWHRWLADLPYRKSMYERYQGKDFQIIGMCIAPNDTSARSVAAENEIPWPLMSADKKLLQTLGIFGEASNYLLNREGVIIGRDLYGADLEAAVQRALKIN